MPKKKPIWEVCWWDGEYTNCMDIEAKNITEIDHRRFKIDGSSAVDLGYIEFIESIKKKK